MELESAFLSGSTTAALSPDDANTWALSTLSYDPVLDDPRDITKALDDLTRDLARESSLFSIRISRHAGPSKATDPNEPKCLTLNSRQLLEVLNSKDECTFELYAISRYLHKKGQPAPVDSRKLQIDLRSFQALAARLNLPARFVVAIPRHFQVCGTGIHKISNSSWDYWCLVPVRVTIGCRALDEEHAKSTAGSNQMDPFHYIHLGGAKVDIRGSHVAIYMLRDAKTSKSVVVVVSLLDGRWGNVVEEPLARVRETLAGTGKTNHFRGPLFVLLIYLSAILQWWNNVLWCFHKQLVMHEKNLQEVIANETSAFSTLSKDTNKHLHIMAAHLHRYTSELSRLHYILEEVVREQVYEPQAAGESHSDATDDCARLMQLISKSNVIKNFCEELERKVQNILTLLFNQIQATNDRTLQAILIAAQDDTSVSRQVAVQSHELSRSMKKDSIAMKTIAIMTMAFLPATTFAALLSMPFFNNDYMSDPAKVWIWIILSAPSTALAFCIFWHIAKRRSMEYSRSRLLIAPPKSTPDENVPLTEV